MKKIIALFFIASSSLFAACCCVPAVSCVQVIISMDGAKFDNINDIITNDANEARIWDEKIQQKLKEINDLKNDSLKISKSLKNLEYANVLESYKEEFNTLKIIEYKKQSSQSKEIINKANLLESKLDFQLKHPINEDEIETSILKK